MLNEWLLAEHRELKRIPNDIITGKAKDFTFLEAFRLNKGHVLFFRNRMGYAYRRQFELYTTSRQRGYVVQDFMIAPYRFEQAHLCLWRDWQPTVEDHMICIIRMWERFKDRKKAYHFGAKTIDDAHTFRRYMKWLCKKLGVSCGAVLMQLRTDSILRRRKLRGA